MRSIPYCLLLIGLTMPLLATDGEKACSRGTANPSMQSARWVSEEQQRYDALYYSLDLTLVPDSNISHGNFLVRLRILDSTIARIELDYSNLAVPRTIHNLTLDGLPAEFEHVDDQLLIPLQDPVAEGDTLEIQLQTTTGPETGCDACGFNWDYTLGHDHIYTNSQPYSAREWWPCKDYPQDKPDSVDIRVTAPAELVVASNGRLMGIQDNGDGTSTTHWHEGYPIATYLVSLAIYPYFVWGDQFINTGGDTVPITHYTYRDTLNSQPDYLVPNYRLLPEMMTAFTALFGEYPFKGEKYGHAEWGIGYGMEHQTLTSMGDPTERRVAHELAHMWWGDMITCETYHDIWLNEGFARYAEALWWEYSRGEAGYREKMESHRYMGNGTIYVEDPENENIFNFGLSYNKASWVLHMLRHVVGDSTFFQILRTYGDTPGLKHATANTSQFQAVCETVSGKDLDNFFQQWIYGQGYPHYLMRWNQYGDSLSVEIIQQGLVFDMPVDLVVATTDTLFETTLQIAAAYEAFPVSLPGAAPITDVALDPDDWVLKEVQVVASRKVEGLLPEVFAIDRIFPNPVNGECRIEFTLPEITAVQLRIFAVSGRLVEDRNLSLLSPGFHTLVWQNSSQYGKPLPAGVYLLQLSAGDQRVVRKLVLVN